MNFQNLRVPYLLILKEQPFWRAVWGEFLQNGFFTLLSFRGATAPPYAELSPPRNYLSTAHSF